MQSMPHTVVITVRPYTLSQASSILTDGILEAIAPSLVNLKHLNLTGCPKVTHHGVWAIVSSTTRGIRGLALEGVYHKFVSYNPPFALNSFGICFFRT